MTIDNIVHEFLLELSDRIDHKRICFTAALLVEGTDEVLNLVEGLELLLDDLLRLNARLDRKRATFNVHENSLVTRAAEHGLTHARIAVDKHLNGVLSHS